MYYYSQQTRGFYNAEIHGSRLISIPDPEWVRPTHDVVLMPREFVIIDGERVVNDTDGPITIPDVPDYSVGPPLVEVANQDCKIPADAVEITEEYHQELLAGAAQSKRIEPDQSGYPVLVDTPEPTREEVVDKAWLAIKAERDRRKAGGVQVGEKWFHSDDSSRIQQLGLVMMGATMPEDIMWKTMDGSFIEMTPTLAQAIFSAAANLDFELFTIAETHRVAMEASEAPSDYDFSGGWPLAFEE